MEEENTIDVTVTNEGTLFTFELHTTAAKEWVKENVPDDAPRMGETMLCVETRYASDLAQGMKEAGLTLE
jgi:hypothetical protein